MPVYRVGAARHPEQGENEEAVSDSVNTVASLTDFTLRIDSSSYGMPIKKCSEDDASTHFLYIIYNKFGELAIKILKLFVLPVVLISSCKVV